ncbi:hypothetical protein FQN54_008666 [Arachnomyces sp. PD_36]|nr:hypothetical protein FQN54_008666 [Arachnomyces sp. PD_36]
MEPPLASLSLTHVHYNPNDSISYLSAWLALVPQALCVVYVTLIWATREVEVLLMFAGQMGCEALNFILKRIIQEERPPQMYGKGYGMPSSHSQFVAFFSFTFTLFLLFRHTPRPSPTHRNMTYPERIAISVLACFCAGAVAVSRVYLNYHTPKQVLAGSIVGTLVAGFWFLFTHLLRQTGWIEWGLDTQLARLIRVRDLVLEEDFVESGWQRFESKRTSRRSRKVASVKSN